MLNKSIAFGLLAAGMMIAPTAALADQSQSVDQYTEQNGAAVNGSATTQTSTTNSRQVQNARSPRTTVINRNGHGYGSGYSTYGRTGKVNQDQNGVQTTKQSGAATDGSTTDQNSRTNNTQRQNVR